MDMNFNYDKNKLKEFVKTYIMTKALYETIHQIETECEKRVLESRCFYVSKELIRKIKEEYKIKSRKRILNPELSYLMSDDAEEYYTLIYEEYKKEGIDHPKGRGYRPSSNAENLLKESENLLLDYMIGISPKEFQEDLEYAKTHWKYREKMLDLILRLDCGKIDMKDFEDFKMKSFKENEEQIRRRICHQLEKI